MKTASFYMLIGAAAFSVLLMGGMDRALATSTSISIYSDAQTYVISDSAEANTSYYGKGAMMISAAVTDPNYLSGTVSRAMNALFSFDTSTAATGTTTSYVTNPVTGVDIVSAFNAAYGTGNWTITDVQMTLASNYYVQGTPPNNNAFNLIASGNFTLSSLPVNPSISSVTWTTLQTYLSTNTPTSDGTFTWTAQPVGTTNNTSSEPTVTYDFGTPNTTLVGDLLSGEAYFLGTPADDQVGYLFNTNNRLAPEITITATENSVPIPAAAWLLGPGLVGLGFLRRKIMA